MTENVFRAEDKHKIIVKQRINELFTKYCRSIVTLCEIWEDNSGTLAREELDLVLSGKKHFSIFPISCKQASQSRYEKEHKKRMSEDVFT